MYANVPIHGTFIILALPLHRVHKLLELLHLEQIIRKTSNMVGTSLLSMAAVFVITGTGVEEIVKITNTPHSVKC